MSLLGSVILSEPATVFEARRKVRLVVLTITNDAITATRLATATSQMARILRKNSTAARIDIALQLDHARGALWVDFVGNHDGKDAELLQPFFDAVERSSSVDGSGVLRGVLTLSHASPDPAGIASLQAMVSQKSRDTLINEIQSKNLELEESLATLTRTRSAKERMESELNIGRDMQMSMLPLTFPAFPDQPVFDVHAALFPAREVGGDFYDLFLIDRDRFCFCVGDVSGKGVSAALFMAVTKTLIKSRAANDASPASILSHVNSELSQRNESCMFVTVFLAILDLRSGEMTYGNAGHNPPFIQRADGTLDRLDQRHGPVVAAVEGIAYGEDRVLLQPDDLLFLYTDGVTEAMNAAEQLYSEERLRTMLNRRRFNTAEGAVSAGVNDVWEFQGDAEQADDVTVLAVIYFGAGATEHQELTVAVSNRLEEIERVNAAFTRFAEQQDLPVGLRRKLCLCIDELLNNVISYGYDDTAEHSIEVHFKLTEDSVVTTVSDDGRPFNPFNEAPPPTGLSLEDRPMGGLGLHLVRNVMDHVAYERHGETNVVRLIKKLDRNGGAKE